ncbi:MAG TPA: quinone-dependent dihydroorotate dehydrogenase [Thiobacillaceae bacterium]|nr:quinone-dependent dihydroorotate dehydrogenase [Thiobacillaceae bacterium]HNU65302.1 quinone-dependent dihydroorotate dehydrogenase [Thiobacillaceae bacterium]
MYALLRPLLFRLDPETAHDLTLTALRRLHPLGLVRPFVPAVPALPMRVMGLDFPNPVGLAAGLDKNGEAIDALGALGFGFLELGAVTPRPQPGNPRPRLFRLPSAQAIINRMGFNNLGVDHLLANLERARYRGILGVNLGKNLDTPIERAAEDYLLLLERLYARVSFVTLNISSPNTRNLRSLQGGSALDALLAAMKARQAELAQEHGRYMPVVVKVAPDLDDAQIAEMAALCRKHRMDGVIATNTTLGRDGVAHLPHGQEAGGLSGAPLRQASTRVLAAFHRALAGEVPLIGAGGILQGGHAREKRDAGASLVQIYTGLIYRGPRLVAECVQALAG